MNYTINVKMGDLIVSSDEESILQTHVGSCVALCLYDPFSKIGGLAHIMLPKYKESYNSNDSMSARYADKAIKTLLFRIKTRSKHVKLQAKMAGGANMFFHENETRVFDIGLDNVNSIRSILSDYKIPIVAEDVGLNHGRHVKFNLKTGKVVVTNRSTEDVRL